MSNLKAGKARQVELKALSKGERIVLSRGFSFLSIYTDGEVEFSNSKSPADKITFKTSLTLGPVSDVLFDTHTIKCNEGSAKVIFYY